MSEENDGEELDLVADRGWLDELNVCLSVLTRVPVIVFVGSSGAAVAGASRFFPVIGVGIGAVGALVLLVFVGLGLPASVSSLLAPAAPALLSGPLPRCWLSGPPRLRRRTRAWNSRTRSADL